ncbi:MAG: S1 RNA-binding domain-containing protein, partial [Planctomycetota bacterium]
GLLHVSELSDQKVENPETFVKVGQELDVRILRIDSNDRKIGLSRRSTAEIQASTSEEAKSEPAAPKPRTELKGGMEGASGPLFSIGETPEVAETEESST